jgi:hypothetical protein
MVDGVEQLAVDLGLDVEVTLSRDDAAQLQHQPRRPASLPVAAAISAHRN